MNRHHENRLASTATVSLAIVLTALVSVEARAAEPWSALSDLRVALRVDSPIHASFVQSYVPAGFSEGETEEGSVALSLPQCLRWDYGEPFPKSFLLCGDTAWYWNPGETQGQKYPVRDRDAPGFDFFLLSMDELQNRYHASAIVTDDGGLEIELVPQQPSEEVVSARVTLDVERRRVTALSYEDAEGNRTQFTLSAYEKGAVRGLFTPPAEIVWEEPG